MSSRNSSASFDPKCQRCPRIVVFLRDGKHEYPTYHCAPVSQFGDPNARLIIVGLAPGFHGANATGRPFTGDYAGILLYETLFKFGLASAAQSIARDDGLMLINARITNAVKCVPPQNKPLPTEISNCNQYLQNELAALTRTTVVLALGTIAHNAVLRAFQLRLAAYKFAHGAEHVLPSKHILIDSYHCSRYNTNTRRLTVTMFHQVFAQAVHQLQHLV